MSSFMQGLESVGQEELEMLHAEAVLSGTAGDDNVWFKAIDARYMTSKISHQKVLLRPA
jgi:hypothetical protein